MRKTLQNVFMISVMALSLTKAQAAGSSAPDGGSSPSKYAHLDPKRLVPRHLLNAALDYFDANQRRIANKNYLTVIDFSKHSGQRRFFVITMSTGAVEALHTAHGQGSDPDHNGYADKFSNVEGSHASSLGFYLTDGTYQGENGYSLYLDGLSSSNSRARERAIVIHGATYVDPSSAKMGRSHGCPALDDSLSSRIINKLKGKSLIYAAK